MCLPYSEACTCFVNFYVFVCLLLGSAQDPVHAKGWVLYTEGYAQLLFCEHDDTEHTMTLLFTTSVKTNCLSSVSLSCPW